MSKDIECSVKDKLKIIAKEQNKRFNELWLNLVLERFLARLSGSAYAKKFVFKGGMLLARYIPLQRETKDLDFLLLEKDYESRLPEILT